MHGALLLISAFLFGYIDTTFLYYQNPKSLIIFFFEQSSSVGFLRIPWSDFSGRSSFNHVLFQQHVFPVFSSSFTGNSHVHTMSCNVSDLLMICLDQNADWPYGLDELQFKRQYTIWSFIVSIN